MKAWRRIFTAAVVFAAITFAAANFILHYLKIPESGRPYRVEINRTALEIEKNGLETIDLSKLEYIYHIEKAGDGFYDSDSDYSIREMKGELYRFDYTANSDGNHWKIVAAVNIILGVMTAAVFGLLFYIREKILSPFERLANVPYELSKGNLTLPIQENKSRFFGKFLWGMDILRENMEQQKQRQLELHREKKMLMLSLSHDIRTPLLAIKLYSKALSKNLYSDTEKQIEIAEKINAKADEIENYVTQIITASREDFLSLEVKNSDFYLSDLFDNITSFYSEKLSLMKTEFIVDRCENCLLYGDRDRSVEVLQNIMENALKYGDGKRVELTASHDDEGVLISVRNSGCTLEQSDLPHIFESFWRGANSENIGGSGLGLYICRQLMHKMNGEIFAEIQGEFITVTAIFGRA